jgi:ATP-dependent RNA helicase DDX56/DBP9
LKHDKALSKKPPASHLRDVPDYLLDPKTQEASKLVKLSRDAMGNSKSMHREGSKKKSRKTRDPLKTFSAEVFLLLLFFSLEVMPLFNICES